MIAVASGTLASAQVVFRVDPTATGSGSGLSWADAYTDLQDALDEAQSELNSFPAPGVEVWVRAARSPYLPTRDRTGNPTPANPRTRTFKIPNGVVLLGGFRGDETFSNQRAGLFRSCILSGDIGVPDDVGDNCFTVGFVESAGTNGSAAQTVIDGFIVTRGNADGPDLTTNPAYRSGGGVFVNASPTLVRNVTFTENFALSAGGALFFEGEGTGSLYGLHVFRSFFYGNSAANGGAVAMTRIGNFQQSLFVQQTYLYNCSFAQNSAVARAGSEGKGGALWIGSRDARVSIANCQIYGNSAQGPGSAIFIGNDSTNPPVIGVEIGSSSIAYNSLVSPGGGVSTMPGRRGAIHYDVLPGAVAEAISNSIVWGNTDGTPTPQQITPTSNLLAVQINHNCLEQSLFVNGTALGQGNKNEDPLFMSPVRLRLQLGSPCVDAGADSLLLPDYPDMNGMFGTTDLLPFDWTGTNVRIFDKVPGSSPSATTFSPNFTDMGAFEQL